MYKKKRNKRNKIKKRKQQKKNALTRCGGSGLFFTNERYSFARDIVFGR